MVGLKEPNISILSDVMKKFLMIVLLSVIVYGCKTDPSFDIAQKEDPITFSIPKGWPTPFYQFENNTLTQEGFELGRRLFYDPRLSRDNTISCASCHQASAAFADQGRDLSKGIDGLLGKRSSPPIFNMNWHTSFFWDGGVNHLESQPINPIQNPVEMDDSLKNIIVKIQQDETYPKMFADAWGDSKVNSQRIFKSLAQFMGAMVSATSKYDKVMRGEGPTFTDAEQRGYNIYKNNCAACHTEPLFTDFSFRNNGIPPTSVNDSGRAHITNKAEDLYKFKIPSLRNLGYTAPFMHDGRFNTLDDVLDHYATGIASSATLDPILANGIPLTSNERSDLLQFLNTLNDEEFTKDERFHEVK